MHYTSRAWRHAASPSVPGKAPQSAAAPVRPATNCSVVVRSLQREKGLGQPAAFQRARRGGSHLGGHLGGAAALRGSRRPMQTRDVTSADSRPRRPGTLENYSTFHCARGPRSSHVRGNAWRHFPAGGRDSRKGCLPAGRAMGMPLRLRIHPRGRYSVSSSSWPGLQAYPPSRASRAG